MKLTFVLSFCLTSSSLIAFTHGQGLVAKLTANDGAAKDEFGRGVALDGDLALVAAKHDNDNGRSSGSAYVFDLSAGKLLAKLTPTDGAAGDFFGDNFISLNGNRALIGSHFDDDKGNNSGSAYLFDVSGEPRQLTKFTAPDGAADDHFGARSKTVQSR